MSVLERSEGMENGTNLPIHATDCSLRADIERHWMNLAPISSCAISWRGKSDQSLVPCLWLGR